MGLFLGPTSGEFPVSMMIEARARHDAIENDRRTFAPVHDKYEADLRTMGKTKRLTSEVHDKSVEVPTTPTIRSCESGSAPGVGRA